MVRTRSAILPDVEHIHSIMEPFYPDGTLLPRQIPELSENIRDFVVAEHEGKIIGCGALHLYGMHLAEIRSIAVRASAQKLGAGKLLLQALLEEAQRQNVTCVCLFTRIPDFFARNGFRVALREDLPDKIYKDCIHCPRFYACDEIAMVHGEIPRNGEKRDLQYARPLVRLGA